VEDDNGYNQLTGLSQSLAVMKYGYMLQTDRRRVNCDDLS